MSDGTKTVIVKTTSPRFGTGYNETSFDALAQAHLRTYCSTLSKTIRGKNTQAARYLYQSNFQALESNEQVTGDALVLKRAIDTPSTSLVNNFKELKLAIQQCLASDTSSKELKTICRQVFRTLNLSRFKAEEKATIITTTAAGSEAEVKDLHAPAQETQ